MTQGAPAKRPAYDPSANPIRVRCEGNVVWGWVYPDGTLEVPCKATACKRPGYETRHLVNPANGVRWNVYVPKPEARPPDR